jgi:hypothetical protein
MRGLWQHAFHRQHFACGTQATNVPALLGMQSSSIVFASRWAACCCLTSRPSGRLRRRLTQALDVRAAFLCSCVVSGTFQLFSGVARPLFRAGLRCCLSCAGAFTAIRARRRISPFHTSWCARLVATWRLSSAVRPSLAGHKLRGIAGQSKQRYCSSSGRRGGLPSNPSFKRTAPPPLNSSVRSLLVALCAGLFSFGNALTGSASLRQAVFGVFGKSSSFKAWGFRLTYFAWHGVVRHGTLGPQSPNQSFKRTAPPPLNSSVSLP